MTVTRYYLTSNKYSRPMKKLSGVLAVVLHWTGNPGLSAMGNRHFFDNRKHGIAGYGSAHYIVGTEGEIIQCMPEDEVAYHCGSDRKDEASGKIYTDYARGKFGNFAALPDILSPNLCTIGVELCPIDASGNFTQRTTRAAVELCADILRRHGLDAQDLTTHHEVVGWKDCPRLWTEHPELFEKFKKEVAMWLAA